MKILQINKYFYLKGGAETVFFNTICLLEKYGHTVIPFTLESDKNNKSPYSAYFVNFPELSESGFWTKLKNIPSFVYNRKAAKQLDRLLQKEKPDIAHIHLMFNSLSVSILPVLKKHNIPVLMTLHDYRLICPAYTFTDGKGKVCERCIKNGNYTNCILNRCSKKNLANSFLLALDSYFRKYFISPTDYINRFVFVSSFSQKKHIEVSDEYNRSAVLYNFSIIQKEKSEKENYFLYFGRISEEKGIPTLLKAIESFPEVQLKIVGTGPLLDSLKRDCSSNVQFVGFKTGDQLHDYIKKAMFVILPSEWYENGPMVIPESYMLGTPVIGSRIGGIPEFIKENETGFLFDAGSIEQLRNAINKALHLTPEEYAKMCENVFLFAEDNFTQENYYKKLISLYEEVLNEKRQ